MAARRAPKSNTGGSKHRLTDDAGVSQRGEERRHVSPEQAEKDRVTEELQKNLGSRDWRINNLYRIKNEDGEVIPFVRNDAQRALAANMHSRNLIAKARQLGLSTDIEVQILDDSVFTNNLKSGIVDSTLGDAEKKLSMIQFAYDSMPEDIKRLRPLKRSNQSEMEFHNGSSISVGTDFRGGTVQNLHISEYGKISVEKPEVARKIKTGAIQAAHARARVWIESTAHGTQGEFYDYVERGKALAASGRALTPLDFKLHFYGWWMKREYRIPNNLVLITKELQEYFTELRDKHGLVLDADQRAWYAAKYTELGYDDIKSEFPSIIEELFFNSIEGAFFKREMGRARHEKRIGFAVPHDPNRRVNTAWDIGEDCTAIIFHQTDGVRHRIIDYFEEEGGSLQSACNYVADLKRERNFHYDKHYGPHDLDHRVWSHNAVPKKDVAKGLGVDFTIVERIEDKGESIDALRRMINNTWIDQERCSRLVEVWDNYRKTWNRQLARFMSDPVHDWASHGSDAGQQLAMGLVPPKPDKDGNRRGQRSQKGSSWAA